MEYLSGVETIDRKMESERYNQSEHFQLSERKEVENFETWMDPSVEMRGGLKFMIQLFWISLCGILELLGGLFFGGSKMMSH